MKMLKLIEVSLTLKQSLTIRKHDETMHYETPSE